VRARAPRALERLELARNDDDGIGELLRFLSVNAHHSDDYSNGGVRFQRRFRRRPSIRKTVPKKAVQEDGSNEGSGLGNSSDDGSTVGTGSG
jgi:hypothetical protein